MKTIHPPTKTTSLSSVILPVLILSYAVVSGEVELSRGAVQTIAAAGCLIGAIIGRGSKQ